MYSIYSTVEGVRVCLYDDTVSNASVKVIDPVLTLEDSAAGSLTFKLAPNNVGYSEQDISYEMVDTVDSDGTVHTKTVTESVDLVGRMRSTITVYRNDTEIWEGRVLSEEKDWNNLRSIYCEGELSYLNDTCQPQRQYHDITVRQFLEAVIAIHNARVDASKQFTIGAVTVNDNNDISYRYTQFEKTMETVNNLVNELGGHLRITKVNGVRYLNYLANYSVISTQTIEFGKNLLDFTCSWDMSELCTVVMPTGHVVQEGQSTTIGDPITPLNAGGVPTTGQLLCVNRDNNTIDLKTDPSFGGYRTAEYAVQAGKNYYISCRLHGGLVAYAMYKVEGGVYNVIDYKTAGSENQIGFTDFVDQKEEMPAGVNRLVVCGWATDIPVTVKDEIEATEELDTYLTVEECPNDGDWHTKGSVYVINQEMVSKYGWIEKQLSLSDIEDKETLYRTAKTYLRDGQFDEMSIEISAVDLSILGANADAIDLLDNVRVISAPHGLDKLFPVTKLEIPLNKPGDQKFTIGTKTTQTLTNVNNDINEDLLSKISAVPSETLVSAQRNAINLIASATNGFITTVMDDDGNPKEFVISNTKDPTQCTSCWVWNVNGLGHFNHYPLTTSEETNPTTTNLALTMDGSIVADRITTGQLSSITIRGCDAVFGGMDNRDGIVLVKSGDSTGYCVQLKNGGVFFGYLNSDGTVTEFGKIQDNKVYEVDGQQKRGLVIDASVLALDVSKLWVSAHSSYDTSGDLETSGGINGTFTIAMLDSGGNIYGQDFTFKHGILV